MGAAAPETPRKVRGVWGGGGNPLTQGFPDFDPKKGPKKGLKNPDFDRILTGF